MAGTVVGHYGVGLNRGLTSPLWSHTKTGIILPRMMHRRPAHLLSLFALLAWSVVTLSACASDDTVELGIEPEADAGADADVCTASFGPGGALGTPVGSSAPNPRMGEQVVYELQVRSANACDPLVGSAEQQEACRARVAPEVDYRAEGTTCSALGQLERIRLGTLDDLLEPTTDYREGITLAYVNERVGATALWFMPLFPNNDIQRIPDPCDNIGSPYAVRDYWHAAGTLSRACILEGRDEYSENPCWANEELREVIDEAHARDMIVMLDIAFNHFGHRYQFYDQANYAPHTNWLAQDPTGEMLWDFEATFDPGLLEPEILDNEETLREQAANYPDLQQALTTLEAECPNLQGQRLVQHVAAWRAALPSERTDWNCDATMLEDMVPGFYLGSDTRRPSQGNGDWFTRDWYDVKFIFHRADQPQWRNEFLRQREYMFRVMNYWVSQGVDGFRLDHATDDFGGMSGEEWRYLIEKVSWYAEQRGQQRPVFLAEEFHRQQEMSPVVDAMTEGFLFDMNGRNGSIKNAGYVERVLENANRFSFNTYIKAGLENHDELRLVDGTGFSPWTGMGFWALGAASWTMPMMLMGQEFGESQRLAFKRSAYLPGRFVGTSSYREDGDQLIAAYRQFIDARLEPENAALLQTGRRFLRTHTGGQADTLVAFVRWGDDATPMLVVHNLWESESSARFVVPPDLAAGIGMTACDEWRAVDTFTGAVLVPCMAGTEWTRSVPIRMPWNRRAAWARMEMCTDAP